MSLFYRGIRDTGEGLKRSFTWETESPSFPGSRHVHEDRLYDVCEDPGKGLWGEVFANPGGVRWACGLSATRYRIRGHIELAGVQDPTIHFSIIISGVVS